MNDTMKLLLCVLVALTLAPVAALAKGPYDGSKALLCAVTETDGCGEGSNCTEGDADDTRVPKFVRVTVKDKKIEILDDGREGEMTKIETVKRSDGRLILQGVEAGRGWTLLISEGTGDTTLTVSDAGFAFAAFGACTTL